MRLSTTILSTTASLAAFAAATFDASSNSNVVLYWGQNSAGSQQDLSYYCASDDVDVLIISFITGFGDIPTLNFGNACSEQSANGLLRCDQIAADIKTCQSNGKKVLLSMGGAAGSYGFTSDSQGEAFASTLWNLFGEGNGANRPFGESVVDGFDFDIENKDQTGYVALANKLKEYYATGSKDYYLAAAPQCVYPDESVGDVLSQVEIDFAYIQFYNNYCNVDKQFNWDTWTDYAANVSPNKNIKLYLGLPGAPSAAGSGYVGIDTIETTLSTISSSPYFGGVMLWDASQGFANQVNGGTFVAAIKSALISVFGGSAATNSAVSSVASLPPTTLSLVTTSSSQQVDFAYAAQVSTNSAVQTATTSSPEPAVQASVPAQPIRITTTLTPSVSVAANTVAAAQLQDNGGQQVSVVQIDQAHAQVAATPTSTTSIYSDRPDIAVKVVTQYQTQTVTIVRQ